jgi:hypothetical protein
MVAGSLYKPQTTNMEGKPLVVMNGPNAGQPTVRYFFAVAIPKNPGEAHWSQTEWGAKILGVAQQGFPQGQWQQPTFAFKIVDGDSAVPNAKGKAPNSREGYPGHWVLSFSSGFAPKIYNRDGSAAIVEPDAVKLGYFVQVNADATSNDSMLKPGIFMNPNMVALSAYGPEIHVGPDVAAAGFGAAALPAGASATPLAPAAAPFAAPLGTPPLGAPAAPFPVGIAPPASPSSPLAPPPQAVPNPAFLGVPPVSPPPAPPAPPAPTGPVMTAAANGATYQQYVQAGWSHAQMVAAGLVVA